MHQAHTSRRNGRCYNTLVFYKQCFMFSRHQTLPNVRLYDHREESNRADRPLHRQYSAFDSRSFSFTFYKRRFCPIAVWLVGGYFGISGCVRCEIDYLPRSDRKSSATSLPRARWFGWVYYPFVSMGVEFGLRNNIKFNFGWNAFRVRFGKWDTSARQRAKTLF